MNTRFFEIACGELSNQGVLTSQLSAHLGATTSLGSAKLALRANVHTGGLSVHDFHQVLSDHDFSVPVGFHYNTQSQWQSSFNHQISIDSDTDVITLSQPSGNQLRSHRLELPQTFYGVEYKQILKGGSEGYLYARTQNG